MSGLTENQGNTYMAESADKIVSDLFSGRLSLKQALQKLRNRLLDLSSRNRLLNYKHPKGRSIQFVGQPNLNLVFNRIIDSKALLIKYVPDPPPYSYTVKRPDVKTFAQSIEIDVETEFSSSSCGDSANKHTPKLQALYYPTDLERFCRKVSSEARTVIEETGTNMLYLVFGFLEFYDKESSEKSMLAPLLAVPVTLEKGSIDSDTRTYQYSIAYSGEDVHENQTLREKLSQDFALQLPEFEEEEDEPGTYFAKIQQAIQKKKGWKIRYQLTLGFLSFGKLAIWDDLNPEKWPGLLDHSLLKEVFSGSSGKGESLFPEDYDIDNHPKGELSLIYDADSSQHSAIIDVLSGKNMVINGPPGTGKSQTITNIIALGLREGKKILFVSEKLAALEVVRRRLNHANLGHFCLELHSHKTQKKKLISDLQDRLDQKFYSPQQLQNKISTLKRHKKELNRYAELMASRIGNELGLTIHEVYWRTEHRRQSIGDLANNVKSVDLADATKWSFDEIELRRAKLEALGELYSDIGSFNPSHPWWGLTPQHLAPGDDETIGSIVSEALKLAEEIVESVSVYQNKTGDHDEPSLLALAHLYKALQTLPEPPKELRGELLPRVFNVQDPQGMHNSALLNSVISRVERAKKLNIKADDLLSPDCELDFDTVEPVIKACSKELSASAFSIPIDDIEESVSEAQQVLKRFERIISETHYAFLPIEGKTLKNFEKKQNKTNSLALENQSIHSIREGASLLLREANRLGQAFERITGIAKRWDIGFDGSPNAVARLECADGIEDILPGVLVDKVVLSKAQKASNYLFSNLALGDLNLLQQELHTLHDRINRALDEIGGYAQQLGLPFDKSLNAVSHLTVLGKISSQAPADLLDYCNPSLGHPRAFEMLSAAEGAYAVEKSLREALVNEFYLDSLPSLNELKSAMLVFRRCDGHFNFLKRDWRDAKKLFRGICKTKERLKAADYEAKVSSIVNWMEHQISFIENKEFIETFGTLFKGTETNFSNIRRLHKWYVDSQAEMLSNPGFLKFKDMYALDSQTINKLSALHSRLETTSAELSSCYNETKHLLGPVLAQLEKVLQQKGWEGYKQNVFIIAESLKNVTSFLGRYIKPEISPKRAFELLNAKMEFASATSDFKILSHGLEAIRECVGPFLPGVATISLVFWEDFLAELRCLAEAAVGLEEFLSEYSESNLTPRRARSFIENKLAFDATLEIFAALPEMSCAIDWESYVAIALRRIDAAAQLVRILKCTGKVGKTFKEVASGLKSRKEANILIRDINNDAAVSAMLKGLLQGFETDLKSLAATLSWGKEVVKNRSIQVSSLKGLLISSEAVSNFYWARRQLQKTVERTESVKKRLNDLQVFGTFSWENWNRSIEEQAKVDFGSSLLERIVAASSNTQAVLPWSKYNAERTECHKMGLSDFVNGLEQENIPSASIGSVFEFVAYRSIGKSIYKSFPELEGFAGAKHDKKRSEFIALDQEIINMTGKSFAYDIDKAKKVPGGNSGYRASEKTEMQLLLHELGKQRRHLPIRQLIKRAGRAVQALKPCFMMGPMAVAQYLEQRAVEFDMVVMDEASQLRPEESLGAIARGKQLVVVGDPKQLPPTNFFERMMDDTDIEEDEDTPAVLVGSESILDICQQIFHPVRTLRWHYRSEHESLIAFSNHHFYSGKLLVFPSPFNRNNRIGLRYRYIKYGAYKDRQNVPEAQSVVDAVIKHMMEYPDESLGVVTLNQTQRDLIEDLLDKKLRNIQETQAFVTKWEEEGWPFFVKNLENVQGDERDIIFISTTFGKAPGTDKVRQNFGPISRSLGWRRLNVLFTRARKKIELFTSMLPEDILIEAKTPAGTRALKDYLDYAKRGVLTGTDISGRDPDSDFELVVGDILRNRGYDVVSQLGVAGFFIDLAVRNPDRPGEFLAAVECDGATYHSSKSARDRDRIRQCILESLGWKGRIWRIWSTDWFYDPRRESERLLKFLEDRRKIVPSIEYDFDDVFEEKNGAALSEPIEEVAAIADQSISIAAEELFVEVGDRVTFCLADDPKERQSLRIVDTEGNPKLNLINEDSPIARALLNSAVGDEAVVEVNGKPIKVIRVLKIQRQEELNLEFTIKPSIQ